MSRYFKYTVYFSVSLFVLLLSSSTGWAQAEPVDCDQFKTLLGKEPAVTWGGCNERGEAAPVPYTLGDCDAPKVVDLYSVWQVGVAPGNGYWGDRYGAPRKGGNLIATGDYFVQGGPTEVVDTFFFFITSPISNTGYCGLKQGDYLALIVRFFGSCAGSDVAARPYNFAFCYEDDLERFSSKHIGPPIPISLPNLIAYTMEKADEKDEYLEPDGKTWKWDLFAYGKDSIITPSPMSSSDLAEMLDLKTVGTRYFYVRYVNKANPNLVKVLKRVTITVYPKPSLIISTDPSDLSDRFREYGVDDEITISVKDPVVFDSIRYYLNSKYLNKYFLGGETDGKGAGEIKLSAMVFTGADDIIRIDARDTNKCFISDQLNVIINVPLPNVFTPDGDGVNDVFFGGDKFADREFHLEVFNRWGNRLYAGNSGWDGMYKGAEVPPGTYYYALQLKSPDGSTKTFKGTVTLVRNRR